MFPTGTIVTLLTEHRRREAERLARRPRVETPPQPQRRKRPIRALRLALTTQR
jgi:hypothetical protein